MSEVAKFIKEYRLSKFLTQKEMAKILGTSKNYYCNVENGKYRASSKWLRTFFEILTPLEQAKFNKAQMQDIKGMFDEI